MADSVVRYLVLSHEIPVYRVFTLGMGNAKVQAASAQQNNNAQAQDASSKSARPYRGPRVQVSVLKNSSIDQLNTQAMAQPGSSTNNQAQPAAQPSPESQSPAQPR
jgi:hypothetical protein